MVNQVHVPLAIATLTATFAGLAFTGAIINRDAELMKGLALSCQQLASMGLGSLITLLIGKAGTSG